MKNTDFLLLKLYFVDSVSPVPYNFNVSTTNTKSTDMPFRFPDFLSRKICVGLFAFFLLSIIPTANAQSVSLDDGLVAYYPFNGNANDESGNGNNGVVKVELQGSCSGGPSSLMTLKQGVQNLLKHYVKEVNSVEAN